MRYDFYMSDSTNDAETTTARAELGWDVTTPVLHARHPVVEGAYRASKGRPFTLVPMAGSGKTAVSSIDFSDLLEGQLFKDFHQVVCKFLCINY